MAQRAGDAGGGGERAHVRSKGRVPAGSQRELKRKPNVERGR